MRRIAAALIALGAVWVIGILAVDDMTALLFLAPAFVLLLPLLAGRYPGEALIVAAARRAPAPRPRRVVSRPRPPARCAPSGGLLVALALAGRGPPA